MSVFNETTINYYKNDFINTKITHIEFCDFLIRHNAFRKNKVVCDIACGSGSGTYYYAKKNINTKFIGIDYNKDLINWSQDYISTLQVNNLHLEFGDWYNLNKEYKMKFDGIFSIHSLCTLKNINDAIDPLVELNPNWIAFNSLFYEGPLDVLIHIRDHSRPEIKDEDPDSDFNIFSLDKLKQYFSLKGYSDFYFQKFNMPIDLPQPKNGARGTFTVQTEFDERAQFSGPVYLPWYFVIARKNY